MLRTALAAGSLLALIVMSTACAVGPPVLAYQEPTSGPIATLTLRSGDGGAANTGVMRFKGGLGGCNCSAEPGEVIAILRNKIIGFGSSRFADKGNYMNEVTVAIPADGSEFRFLAVVTTTSGGLSNAQTRNCQAHVSFTPKPGSTYIASHEPLKSMCTFEVHEVVAGKSFPVQTEDRLPCLDASPETDWYRKAIKEFCERNPEKYGLPTSSS